MAESSEWPRTSNTDYRCPECGDVFGRYQTRCPACGEPIDQVFSGRYRPGRGRVARCFAWAIIVPFLLSVATGVLLAACSPWL